MPLGEVAELDLQTGLNQINRENGKRRVVVTANVRGRDLGSFVQEVKRVVGAGVEIPAGYWVEYGGTFQQLESASQATARRRAGHVAAYRRSSLYGIAFRARCGRHFLRHSACTYGWRACAVAARYSDVHLRRRGIHCAVGRCRIERSCHGELHSRVCAHEAWPCWMRSTQGALTRLRPVLMTALVASLGFVPMAFNTGIGSEVQRPLATVVIGGILSSTALTLLVLPALYRLAASTVAAKVTVNRTSVAPGRA